MATTFVIDFAEPSYTVNVLCQWYYVTVMDLLELPAGESPCLSSTAMNKIQLTPLNVEELELQKIQKRGENKGDGLAEKRRKDKEDRERTDGK
ncbi:hypothetical protein DNTS_033989 [Danionella cerebrum]|uniref:Uncharacterized protein n=1 Tax=Danionella cerebrum TaxID=2873325 RepID=A0A553RAH8_9TELE|nr:hypothetical protein DNTS_033989 [Danionella translucida]